MQPNDKTGSIRLDGRPLLTHGKPWSADKELRFIAKISEKLLTGFNMTGVDGAGRGASLGMVRMLRLIRIK